MVSYSRMSYFLTHGFFLKYALCRFNVFSLFGIWFKLLHWQFAALEFYFYTALSTLYFRFCISTQDIKIKDGASDEDTLALWGMSKDCYAQYLLSRGDFKTAMDEFRGAHETCLKLFGESHPQTIVLLNSLGTVASIMDDDETAVSYFQNAARLARVAEDDNLATYNVNLGLARIKLVRKKELRIGCIDSW
jgi:hypothetical protein